MSSMLVSQTETVYLRLRLVESVLRRVCLEVPERAPREDSI